MNAASRGTTVAGAFTRLLEMLRPDLLRFAYWLARDRSVAEDVVQETLIRAWKSREELKDPAAARPWLFTIVRREHARLYEHKRLPTVDVDSVEALGDPALASDRKLKEPAAARPWLFTIVRREHARPYERKRLPTVDVDSVEALSDPALA